MAFVPYAVTFLLAGLAGLSHSFTDPLALLVIGGVASAINVAAGKLLHKSPPPAAK